MPRRVYFSFVKETEQFDKALNVRLQNMSREKRVSMLPPENIMRYNHGIKWVTVSSDSSDTEGEMQIHSTETMISMDDIRQHKLEALPKFLNEITEQMQKSMQQMLYQTVSDSCEKSGNTVSAKEHETNADAFLATLKKIEFGVDREGNVTLPEFHMSPGMFEKFQKEAEEKGQSFKDEVEKVKEEKSKAALDREKARRERFKT